MPRNASRATAVARNPRDQRSSSDILKPPPATSLPRFLKSKCLPKVNELASRFAQYDGQPPRSAVMENLRFVRNRLLPYLEFDVAKEMTPKLAAYGVEEMLHNLKDPQNRLPRDVAEYADGLYQKFEVESWDATPKPKALVFTGELPPEDHAIWGVDGIMHGAAMTKEPGKKLDYKFDPRYSDERIDGEVYGHNGLRVGDWFPKLIIANFRGAHSQLQRGICGDENNGAYSILISNHYSGLDMDEGDVLYYSAEGAKGKDAREKFDLKANQAMAASQRSGNPVRVLRSAKGARNRHFAPSRGIRYDGLYDVTEMRVLVNDKGSFYQRFKLERRGGQPTLESIRHIPTEQQRQDFERIKEAWSRLPRRRSNRKYIWTSRERRTNLELSQTVEDVAPEAAGSMEHNQNIMKGEDVDTITSNSDGYRPESYLEPIYSVIPKNQKIVIILIVAVSSMFSPLTGAIYLPALDSIASDLKVKPELVNLSITTYQIFQGLAPSFIGCLSDVKGRRIAYITTFSIYLVANLALALQDSYPALMVLRCLQSAGSSTTIALGSATVTDLYTRAERGTWSGYTTLGVSLGPALGPVIGGLLDQYLGWHSIFWFLFIFGGILTVTIVVMLPETGRSVVGNGSVPPSKWNRSIMQWYRARNGKPINGGEFHAEDASTIQTHRRRPSPMSSLYILLELEGGITLVFGAFFFAGYFMVMTTLSEQLDIRFGFSPAVTGLCYLPLGVGSMISRWSAGKLFDYNFRRHARLLGQPLDLSRQQAIETFPIERIRLEVCIPMVYISCGTVLAYAWTMETQSNLAGIEVALFFMGLFSSGVQQGLNTLVLDTHPDTPATATASNNLFRCLLSAGGTAVAPFMIDKTGIGLMGVFISGVWLVLSPCLWLVMLRGQKWREDEQARQEMKGARKGQSECETG
ncbi:hypothetical protein VMCG_04924 [Cytospora schulzeri]|uniref:Major facilitator superfamily (MFS) profile domain-containing protein n=1 Tax=Cytospora schulzeri TaxID=448051 RepID=A0A423WN53_9PEZI|nr:hypothetical protein VMCG_04924 [Valsa malicola]